MILAFVTVSATLGSRPLRGLTALAFGIWLGLVGVDLQTGQARFTFGLLELLDGINMIIVCVGLFAVGETLGLARRASLRESSIVPVRGSLWLSAEDWRRAWPAWLRGAGIGSPIGALPAGGAEVPTFLSYWLERRLARRPEEFGRRAIEGVAGPEAANDASAAGVLLLALLALFAPLLWRRLVHRNLASG